jgi:drug/metabolite transporter (DMT)-like permease
VSGRGGEAAAVAAMVAATLLWGGTFVAIRDSVGAIPPATLVCGRFAVAAALFAGTIALRGRAPARRDLWIGAGSGALMLGGYYFQAEGLRFTSAGSSAFLTCAGTLLAAFFAWPLLRQRPGPALAAGIAIAMAGSALLSLREGLHLGRGEALTLLGAASYALQVVLLGRFAAGADPLVLAGTQAATVALALAPFARGAGEVFGALDPPGWGRFAYLAVAGSTLAPLLQVLAQRRLPPGRIGLLFALEPVFALVFALTLGAERFEARWWAGAGLILFAVVLVEWRAAASARR